MDNVWDLRVSHRANDEAVERESLLNGELESQDSEPQTAVEGGWEKASLEVALMKSQDTRDVDIDAD